jgi:pyruvate dehydrogenase E2 component (dihydrolipoamide acetyltransferase)
MPEVQMPKLSDTMTEGTLVSWKKKKGDKVSTGDVLAEIETDKATMEWESPEDGTLTEIYVEEGGKVNVGDKIAFIGEEGEAAPTEEKKEKKPEEKKAEPKKEKKAQTESEKPASAKKEEEETAPPQAKPTESKKTAEKSKTPEARTISTDEARVKASPVARRVAGELGVDLSSVNGTGPEGRVTESDVRAAAKSKSAPPKQSSPSAAPAIKPGEGTRINLSGMRKVIAERLVASKSPIPHFYLNIDIDAGPLMAARAELKSAGEGADAAKITVNDFVLKASVQAAVKVPKVNASFDGDAIVQYAEVDLGIAVAIEDGLLTPVIRSAQNKSLREISESAKDLAHRARNKRMKPEEFQGGSFTVSNLGGMGIDSFSAIINPPQGFILAIGAISKKPVVDSSEQIVIGHRMSIWMSCDHRVIDGALGAEYLKELRHLLENPALLLV